MVRCPSYQGGHVVEQKLTKEQARKALLEALSDEESVALYFYIVRQYNVNLPPCHTAREARSLLSKVKVKSLYRHALRMLQKNFKQQKQKIDYDIYQDILDSILTLTEKLKTYYEDIYWRGELKFPIVCQSAISLVDTTQQTREKAIALFKDGSPFNLTVNHPVLGSVIVTTHAIIRLIERISKSFVKQKSTRKYWEKLLVKTFTDSIEKDLPPEMKVTRIINNSFKPARYFQNEGLRFIIGHDKKNTLLVTVEHTDPQKNLSFHRSA